MNKWFKGIMIAAFAGTLMAASAPFLPDETKPSDTDVISQYPAIERTFRDIIESWILVDHDATTGGHEQVTLVDQASDPTFASGVIGLWNNAGILNTRVASGTVTALSGTPAGSVIDFAGSSAPTGWLLAYGQCVSRTTYAVLFAVIGTLYDDGCSGSDFGIPDTRGRVTAGDDDMGSVSANRLTGLTNGVNGDTLGATGGLESFTLAITNIPNHQHTLSHTHQFSHTHLYNKVTNIANEQGQSGDHSGTTQQSSAASGTPNTTTTGFNSANSGFTGSTTAKDHIQPTIIFMKIIKT